MKPRLGRETNWGIVLLLLAALLLIVNYLGYRHYHRWDLSASKNFSISPQTRKVLRGLSTPVKVVVFLSPADPIYGRVKDLLDGYAVETPKLSVTYLDPDRDRAAVQREADRYHVSVANVVVFDSGQRSKYVEKDQMVDYDFSAISRGGKAKVKAFKAEEAFTNAILDVLTTKKPVVAFTTGHGERLSGRKGYGMETFRQRLAKEGNDVKEWLSLGKASVPADFSCLIVAGPQKPFLPSEASKLGDYLARGGRVFVLLDPVIAAGRPPTFSKTGLEALLKRWGVWVRRDIVLDPGASVPSLGAQTFFSSNYGSHPVVNDLAKNKYPVLLTLAASLDLSDPSVEGYHSLALLKSSAASWGKRSLADLDKPAEQGKGDLTGPLVLAAAVDSTKETKGARLVVVGDADIASDALLESGAGNLLFCLNAVHWLLAQENRLAIPPKSTVETHLALTASQSNMLFLLFVLVIPALVAGTGLFVFLQRRK